MSKKEKTEKEIEESIEKTKQLIVDIKSGKVKTNIHPLMRRFGMNARSAKQYRLANLECHLSYLEDLKKKDPNRDKKRNECP